MPRSKRKVTKTLKSKLKFQESPRNHRMYEYKSGGGMVAQTMVSHGGGKDIDDNLLSKMARQMHINRAQLVEIVDCGMSRKEYLEALRLTGKVRG